MTRNESISNIALENMAIIEKMKEEGEIEKELAEVLLKNTIANQSVYNSIGNVVKDVRKLSEKVDSVEEKVVSLESVISELKASVDGVLQQNKDSQAKIETLDKIRVDEIQREMIRVAKKEMFSEFISDTSTFLRFFVLISASIGLVGGIWKYLVQSAL